MDLYEKNGNILYILNILKSHDCICNRDYNGGAGVIKDEHPSVSVF